MSSYDMPATQYIHWPDSFYQTTDMRNQYDADIRQIVEVFNRYLGNKYPKSNYHDLDWRLVKAMIWIESGHKHSAWRYRPMQIGNHGDAGLIALLHLKKIRLKNGNFRIQSEGAELVIPPEYVSNLTIKNKEKIRYNPQLNIQAGVAYLLMRHAKIGYKTVADNDAKEHIVTIKVGDSLNKIAVTHQTTVGIIKQLNPGINKCNLHMGVKLRYKKATVKKTIKGWVPMTFSSVARKYNAKGDYRYRQKLRYAFQNIESSWFKVVY
ncbi:LysM domain-containing protein [Commensalibacter papalotli (ex Botero et al. 2024)]|uniref:LysM repeat (LysM) (PDB:1E0G) n=1 Tax=Commensalibacter papalotli (ex Botero et al. 2024) TaxID=2972766 RepID=A0ABM9HLG2_9PROT|nr:LysM domain-containing protein [Commensalibacter papalotli (ex Botero et al. 2024)]CAI3932088.1 LysM repeat (LysM) (PDB:1E0G) [Commensalibacter papalotli (ex Botero et al. 2024)]CAI3946590.1 LysM repeat (LysM) (PDB:1E0G) [Commensalibacter papalotli (ex Botero et al. 2024)]